MTCNRGWVLAALMVGGTSVMAQPAQLPFETVPAQYQTVLREQVVDALIEAVQQATVSAQTSGRVLEVNFDTDDYVSKGDVLLRFRDAEQRAALKAAEARFAEAEAEFKRIRDVFEKKLVAKAAYDRAESAYKSARAALDQAQEQLEYTVVRAPYSGIVVKRHIEVGELANPGQALMTGLSLERLRAVADVPQRYIDTVRSLGKARVLLAEGDGAGIESSQLTISPYADPASHTFKVRVELQTGQAGIYPGMFAKVAFTVGEERRLVVPAQALAYRSEVTAVYLVTAAGRVALRQVRVGRVLPDGSVEVLAGLAEGDQVALDPIRAGIYLKEQRAGGGS